MLRGIFHSVPLLVAFAAVSVGARAQTSATVVTPQISPSAVYVGQSTQVTVTANLSSDTTLVPSSVVLFKYDDNGNLLGSMGSLYDDGTHGDAKAGDGIYTTQVTLAAQTSESAVVFKTSTLHKGSLARTLSDPAQFDFLSPLTSQQVSDLNTIPQAAGTLYNNLLTSGVPLSNAQAQTVAWLQSQPGVATAQPADNGSSGIWLVFTSGILGGITLPVDGVRGGGGVQKHASYQPPVSGKTIRPMIQAAATSASGDTLPNTSAIVLDPFNFEFPSDETQPIYTILNNRLCGLTSQPVLNGSANRAAFRTLNQYGINAIISHGDTWFQGFDPSVYIPGTNIKFPLLIHLHNVSPSVGTSLNVVGSQVVFYSGEIAASLDNLDIGTLQDLKNGDLALGYRPYFDSNILHSGLYYVITPAFIHDYDTNFPDTITYIDSCRSLFVDNAAINASKIAPPSNPPNNNYTMAQMFLGNGAKAYLGYTEYVPAAYGSTVGTAFFSNLISSNQPVGAALTSVTQNTGGLGNVLETGSTGLAYLELAPGSDVNLQLPVCTVAPDFEFDDGAPGNLTIYVDSTAYNLTGLGPLATRSLGFSSLQLGNHTIVVYANGGFADYTINLPAPFTFSFGGSTASNRVISFAGPVTYQFSSPSSTSVKVVPNLPIPKQLTTVGLRTTPFN